ncbi:streptamidine family RiPP [Nocardioides plantarum]|uniref:Streptamidine family RiPP n=1 Tax=Nocardioides plantarum TaxID=29299 RepID=A0ABV5K881_9ACTN|nr:streptamidine family RiPP [Nocardioides plantarum]
MNELFSPVSQRPQRSTLSTHSAGHSNALVENPFDEVEATETD